MIRLITLIVQLVIFVIADSVWIMLTGKAAFPGHNHYRYYRDRWGVIRSDWNQDSQKYLWHEGKYSALFGRRTR